MTVTSVQPSVYPPGPDSGRLGLGLFPIYREDPIKLAALSASYGGLSHMRLGPVHAYLVNDHELLYSVLVDEAEKYYKSTKSKIVLGRFLGDGILLNDGEDWLRRRRMVQPAFHHKRIEAYTEIMTDITQRTVSEWQHGEVRDISTDMMRLTLDIVAKTLFNVETKAEADRIDRIMNVVHEAVTRLLRSMLVLDWIPTKANREWKEAVAELNDIIMTIIRDRRQSNEDKGDLLSMLMASTDEHGVKLTDEQVRHEAITIFLAGHDTTANALSWAWYLLSTHPDVRAKLKQEVQTVLGGRTATLNDLPQLKYTDWVVKEVLRLYTPSYLFLRQVAEETTLGGYRLKKGSLILISPYLLHRRAEIFENPEAFIPERWDNDLEKRLPKYAYIPFSAGPRICIGNTFALMEARLVLATMLQSCELDLVPGAVVEHHSLITLRVKDQLPMRVNCNV
jgi:cytochrome P450